MAVYVACVCVGGGGGGSGRLICYMSMGWTICGVTLIMDGVYSSAGSLFPSLGGLHLIGDVSLYLY